MTNDNDTSSCFVECFLSFVFILFASYHLTNDILLECCVDACSILFLVIDFPVTMSDDYESPDEQQVAAYYDELQSLLTNLQTSLETHHDGQSSQDVSTTDSWKEVRDLLRLLSVQIRSLSDDDDTQRERTDVWKARLSSCKSQFQALQHLQQTQQLVGATTNSTTKSQTTEDIAQRSLSNLHHAQQSLADTELVGRDVCTELDRQKQTIQQSQSKVQTMNELTERAQSLLTSMSSKWPWKR